MNALPVGPGPHDATRLYLLARWVVLSLWVWPRRALLWELWRWLVVSCGTLPICSTDLLRRYVETTESAAFLGLVFLLLSTAGYGAIVWPLWRARPHWTIPARLVVLHILWVSLLATAWFLLTASMRLACLAENYTWAASATLLLGLAVFGVLQSALYQYVVGEMDKDM